MCTVIIHILLSTKLVIILGKYGREEKIKNSDSNSSVFRI
jgi:hypothetical protein